MGHVNNAIYLTYFEEARMELFRCFFGFAAPADFPFIMATASCRFLRPVELKDSPLEVAIGVSHVGRKSFVFQYRIYRFESPEEIFAEGDSVQVYYDYAAESSIEIPADFRVKLESFLVD
jgi:acyl-CoA thioester hydrolase